MGTFVIAEAGSSHDNDLQKAYRLIEAAKECGADAVKFQWTSNADAMAQRRKLGVDAFAMYRKYLEKPISWLESLKAHADKVGIEFMVTSYIVDDIKAIAPFVKRYKVSAFESQDAIFIAKHLYPWDRQHSEVIVSLNPGQTIPMNLDATNVLKKLHCISLYPAPIETLKLEIGLLGKDGFSDHTANVLTGAAAVAAGAKIIEAHIRLQDTEPSNPDYGHSLVATPVMEQRYERSAYQFQEYVQNIRTVERML